MVVRDVTELSQLPSKVSEWSPDDVRDWLFHGLATWHLQDIQPPPFSPLSDRFSRRDSAADGISRLCARSTRFRSMLLPEIARLLESVPADPTGYRVFNQLQILISELHEPDLIEPMWMRLVVPGFLTRASDEVKQELFARAFLSAEKLTASRQARSYLRNRMLASPFFDPKWTPTAFSTMVKVEPRDIGSSLVCLSPYVDRQEMNDYAAQIVDGCRAVLLELFAHHGDPQTIIEGINSDELFALAEDLNNRPVTGRVAQMILDETSIEIRPKSESEGQDSSVIKVAFEKVWELGRRATTSVPYANHLKSITTPDVARAHFQRGIFLRRKHAAFKQDSFEAEIDREKDRESA
jgi:hypothetical protein